VVELAASATNSNPSGGTFHFMLPGNFPDAGSTPSQSVNALILTDARTYLPSGLATLQPGDKVAPGYCWFDVPPELRPKLGTSATVTVFALKAITSNHPPQQGSPLTSIAHALNRTDWIDAIKTASAQISILASSGRDVSFAHKIPFNYPWDIVVVNGPAVLVKP
jgi:hypothetical protein